jgi:uncharacterized protein (DUF2252 family)
VRRWEATSRSRKQLAREAIEDEKPVIPLGKRFWRLSAEERAAIDELVATERLHRVATAHRSRDDDAEVVVRDAANWTKGCSSLDRLRVAVLLAVKSHKSGGGSLCLIDVKGDCRRRATAHRQQNAACDNAERVVEGERHLAPYLGERVVAVRLLDRSVFLREMLPQDLKLEINQLIRPKAMKAARFLASRMGARWVRRCGANGGPRSTGAARNIGMRRFGYGRASWAWSPAMRRPISKHCRRYLAETAA